MFKTCNKTLYINETALQASTQYIRSPSAITNSTHPEIKVIVVGQLLACSDSVDGSVAL